MTPQANKLIDNTVKILTALSTAGILALFGAYNSISERFAEDEVHLARIEVRLDNLTQQMATLQLCQQEHGSQLHEILVQLARHESEDPK